LSLTAAAHLVLFVLLEVTRAQDRLFLHLQALFALLEDIASLVFKQDARVRLELIILTPGQKT
jgi:hypothetical protein